MSAGTQRPPGMQPHRMRALAWLRAHGAQDIQHQNGSLLSHLERAERLLRRWDAGEALCLAGLCHAAYGTDGFAPSLLATSQRPLLAGVIGREAEEIVYFYASCDRAAVYPQLGRAARVRFRDRFAGDDVGPTDSQLQAFLELTFANEIDVVSTTAGRPRSDWQQLIDLLSRCEGLVSEGARLSFRRLFPEAP
jgi:hypothetical protein